MVLLDRLVRGPRRNQLGQAELRGTSRCWRPSFLHRRSGEARGWRRHTGEAAWRARARWLDTTKLIHRFACKAFESCRGMSLDNVSGVPPIPGKRSTGSSRANAGLSGFAALGYSDLVEGAEPSREDKKLTCLPKMRILMNLIQKHWNPRPKATAPYGPVHPFTHPKKYGGVNSRMLEQTAPISSKIWHRHGP